MNIAGIIAEYNPFHNGHFYHLQEAKRITSADLMIVVMSGSFVQRGTPAILDKWTRAKMALVAGADLVLELPTIFSCNSASSFAFGSILTLETALAKNFVCGAENNQTDLFKKVAQVCANEPPEYQITLHKNLSQGNSFAKAHALAILKLIPEAKAIIRGSNNILAINYLKAKYTLESNIEPIFIKRKGSSYQSKDLGHYYSSATAIRETLPNLNDVEPFMPPFAYHLLSEAIKKGNAPIKLEDFSNLLLSLLRRAQTKDLISFPEMEPGMPELFINNSRLCSNISDFVNKCTSKRYPAGRIRRMLIRILLNIDNTLYYNTLSIKQAPYLRILGFKKEKSAQIKTWRSMVNAPIIQRPAHFQPTSPISEAMWNLDLRATDLYTLHLNSQKLSSRRQDMCHPLVII